MNDERWAVDYTTEWEAVFPSYCCDDDDDDDDDNLGCQRDMSSLRGVFQYRVERLVTNSLQYRVERLATNSLQYRVERLATNSLATESL